MNTTLVFYAAVVILLFVVLFMDFGDYNCHNVLVGKEPSAGYCVSMITGVPNNSESISDSTKKMKELNGRLTNIVFWRRAFASAVISMLLIGWLITANGYFEPKTFLIAVIVSFLFFFFMFTWLSYHFIRPIATMNNRLYDRIAAIL